MSGEHVRFQFFGVCTHIKPAAIAPRFADWDHRVVLVNASDPARFEHHPKLKGIAPHHATLQILKRDMRDEKPPDRPWFRLSPDPVRSDTHEWMLDGVFLKVANGRPSDNDDEEENCMPRVQNFVDTDFKLTTTSPRGYLADPELTSCFVDLPRQSLRGRTFGEASVGVFDVFTGEEEPEIRVIGFGGELLCFRLNRGAQVSVCNLPEDSEKDDDRDFYLHLLLVPGMVTPRGAPSKTCSVPLTTDNAPVRITQITTAACSNSNYP